MARRVSAAVLPSYGDTANLHPGDSTLPVLCPGEVLVQVHSSPINPSDLYFIRGSRANLPPLPTVPGLEGSGVVVEAGEGDLGASLVGKRVHTYGFAVPTNKMWAEYTVAKAENCVPLLDSVDFDQGACLYVNPMTVMMFREIIAQGGHKAAVQDVANSALGKMMVRLCRMDNVPLINIVRSQSARDSLVAEDAQYILDSSTPTFDRDLRSLSEQLHATVGFDAISGDFAGRFMSGLAPGSTLYVYSGLSGQPSSGFKNIDIIMEEKTFKGRMMPLWLGKKTVEERKSLFEEIQRLVPTVFRSEFVGHYGVQDVQTAVSRYVSNMSAGKILIHPSP